MFKLWKHAHIGVLSMFVLVLLMLGAILAPWIAPYPQDCLNATHLERALQPPSWKHLLGTDDMGRDLLSRIIYGARISLLMGIASIVLATAIGGMLGIIAGYFGGLVDEVIMRTADIFMSVPYVILGMVIAIALTPGVKNLIIVIALLYWPATARLMRSQVIIVREREYVEAAKAIGANTWRIMTMHIAPNSIAAVVVQGTIQIGWAILLGATLSFLGVGIQPPLPEWGLMTSTGRQFMLNAWWYPTFPGLAIVLTVMAFNLVGDTLRDILDPYLRGH